MSGTCAAFGLYLNDLKAEASHPVVLHNLLCVLATARKLANKVFFEQGGGISELNHGVMSQQQAVVYLAVAVSWLASFLVDCCGMT